MGDRGGMADNKIIAALLEIQEPWGARVPVWADSVTVALAATGYVSENFVIGAERALRRLRRHKIVQRKIFQGRAFYALTKSARDKYLEE